jgi:hypothetical protein
MDEKESIVGPADIACTLDAAGFATQSERWTQIVAHAAIDRVETEDGIRVDFRAEPGVEQVIRELVALESECCSWASWTVEVSDDEIVLQVTSVGDGVAVVHSLLARLASC